MILKCHFFLGLIISFDQRIIEIDYLFGCWPGLGSFTMMQLTETPVSINQAKSQVQLMSGVLFCHNGSLTASLACGIRKKKEKKKTDFLQFHDEY